VSAGANLKPGVMGDDLVLRSVSRGWPCPGRPGIWVHKGYPGIHSATPGIWAHGRSLMGPWGWICSLRTWGHPSDEADLSLVHGGGLGSLVHRAFIIGFTFLVLLFSFLLAT
jgi:hypothetical protein